MLTDFFLSIILFSKKPNYTDRDTIYKYKSDLYTSLVLQVELNWVYFPLLNTLNAHILLHILTLIF